MPLSLAEMFPISYATTDAGRRREGAWISAATADLPIFFPTSLLLSFLPPPSFCLSVWFLLSSSQSLIVPILYISLAMLMFFDSLPVSLSSTTILHFPSFNPFPQSWQSLLKSNTVLGVLCLHAGPGFWLSGPLNAVCLSKGTVLTYSAVTTSFYFSPKALGRQQPDQHVPSGT